MRLLIVTQAVDTEDRALGFFVRWIEELAKCTERTEVICLKEGKHELPKNVRMHSLGKEMGVSRVKYVFNFYRYIWRLRHDYDTVFVHMNEEYVLLGGLFWRMTEKRVVLWRNHKMGSWRTWLAVALADGVCHTSPQAFVASSTKAVHMPIGIDTRFFSAPAEPAPQNTILFLGRLDVVKNPKLFLRALQLLANKGADFSADLYGDPTDSESLYAKECIALASPLVSRGVLALHRGVPHAQTPGLYQSHAIYVNLTPSGSFDKTIGEAMASGCVVVTENDAIRSVIPDTLIPSDSPEEVAEALMTALTMDESERVSIRTHSRAYVEEEHSLQLLTRRLTGILQDKVTRI